MQHCTKPLTHELLVQKGRELALQRKQLRLFKSPLSTLYYFFGSASAATGRGLVWLLRHRITLFLLIPAVLGYIALKVTGNQPSDLQAALTQTLTAMLALVGLGQDYRALSGLQHLKAEYDCSCKCLLQMPIT